MMLAIGAVVTYKSIQGEFWPARVTCNYGDSNVYDLAIKAGNGNFVKLAGVPICKHDNEKRCILPPAEK